MNPTAYPNPTYDEQKYDDIFGKLKMVVAEKRDEIEDFATTHHDMVLRADTSSGKSLAFPIELLEVQDQLGETGEGKIGLIEPRQDTTRQNAENIAKIYGAAAPEKVRNKKSNEIGYQMRGDNREGGKINAMTDGYLIEIMRHDPLLKNYWALIFDEKHENTWNQDFGQALVKEIINPRRIAAGMKPIRLSSVSATIDAPKESKYLTDQRDDNAIFDITVERQYKITPHFLVEPLPKGSNHLKETAKMIASIVDFDDGDIFAFIEGTAEMEKTHAFLQDELGPKIAEFEILYLHAGMSDDEKKAATGSRPLGGKRRIVLTTNVGETGVNVPELTQIVDTGLIKENRYDPATGTEQLVTVPHTRSGLKQRGGRGGRYADGRYFGMYTKEDYLSRPEYPGHEIDRMNLMDAVLDMKGMGVPDVYTFNLPKRPEKEKLDIAIRELQNLRVLDENGNLTPDGETIYKLGIGAERGRMILEGIANNCLDEMVSVAALLASGRTPFMQPKRNEDNFRLHMTQSKFNVLPGTDINPSSDPLRYLAAWEQYVQNGKTKRWAENNFLRFSALDAADRERTDILGRLKSLGIPVVPSDFSNAEGDETKAKESKAKALRESVAAGLVNRFMFFDPAIKKYRLLTNPQMTVNLNPDSSLPEYKDKFVASVGLEGPKGRSQDSKASICQSVDPEWIVKFLPHICIKYDERKYSDGTTGKQMRKYKARLSTAPVELGTIIEEVKEVDNRFKLKSTTTINPKQPNRPPRNPLTERPANPNRVATNLANDPEFPPNNENQESISRLRRLWLKLQGKL